MPRSSTARALWCLSPLLLMACPPDGPGDAGSIDGGLLDGGHDDGGPAGPEGLPLLDALDDVATLAGASGAVKYLAPVAEAAPRPPLDDECAFQNTARYPFHLEYLRAQPGGEQLTYQDYLALVLRRQTRVWWGGEVRWQADDEHPLTGAQGVLEYTLYTEDSPGNRLQIDDVRAVHAALTDCAPAFEGTLAFSPTSNEQRATVATIRDTLADEGIAVVVD